MSVPETFDEAAYEAASKLSVSFDCNHSLNGSYAALKSYYFDHYGKAITTWGLNVDGYIDALISELFSIARAEGQFFLGEIVNTVVSKQHDYGHENIAQFGEVGLVVRLADKVARIANLAGREAQNESLKDSYLDVCGYTVLFRMWRDGTFLLPLAEDSGDYGADHLWPEDEGYPEDGPKATDPYYTPDAAKDPIHIEDHYNGDDAVEEYEAKLDFYGVDVGNVRGGW